MNAKRILFQLGLILTAAVALAAPASSLGVESTLGESSLNALFDNNRAAGHTAGPTLIQLMKTNGASPAPLALPRLVLASYEDWTPCASLGDKSQRLRRAASQCDSLVAAGRLSSCQVELVSFNLPGVPRLMSPDGARELADRLETRARRGDEQDCRDAGGEGRVPTPPQPIYEPPTPPQPQPAPYAPPVETHPEETPPPEEPAPSAEPQRVEPPADPADPYQPERRIHPHYERTFSCNITPSEVMSRVEGNFSSYASYYKGSQWASFTRGPLEPGKELSITSKFPATNWSIMSSKVRVRRVGHYSFVFDTVEDEHPFYPGTITFRIADAGSGNVKFSVDVNSDFAPGRLGVKARMGFYVLGGKGFEGRIWGNLMDKVEEQCKNPWNSFGSNER